MGTTYIHEDFGYCLFVRIASMDYGDVAVFQFSDGLIKVSYWDGTKGGGVEVGWVSSDYIHAPSFKSSILKSDLQTTS